MAWALAWRYNPQTGTVILPGQNSLPLDPSLGTDSPPVSIFKAGFDCTIPVVGHPDRFAYAAATVSEPLTVAVAVAVGGPADDAFEQCQDRSQAGSRLRWLHQVQTRLFPGLVNKVVIPDSTSVRIRARAPSMAIRPIRRSVRSPPPAGARSSSVIRALRARHLARST